MPVDIVRLLIVFVFGVHIEIVRIILILDAGFIGEQIPTLIVLVRQGVC